MHGVKHYITILPLMALAGCIGMAQGTNGMPLPHAAKRPTPLNFGLYVTPEPARNPINPPERFTGYHAAIDFELLPGEENATVPVYAICTGTISFSGFAEGYGGLVTQHCSMNAQEVTVLYGHLAIASLVEQGALVHTGHILGVLGSARSRDTDGSRKHLHLGILKGHVSDVRGYVQDEAELDTYINPTEILDL